MAKITLIDVSSGYNLSAINANFQAIESEFNNKTLYRDNPVGEDNALNSDIDANNKRIFNLPEPLNNFEPVRKIDLLAAAGTIGDADTLNALYDIATRLAEEAGYTMSGRFDVGFTLTSAGQVAWYPTDNNYYEWTGTFPKVVPPSSTPAGTGGIGAGAWVDRTDVTLRSDLSASGGSSLVGYGSPYNTTEAALDELFNRANKQRINISAFGSTGTSSVGSIEAWDNAMAYAKSIAPLYTNNIGQSWFDLSGFEFVSDSVVYVNSPIKLRSTIGTTVLFSTAAADDFVGSYIIDTSLAVSGDAALNRQPLHTRWRGSVDCRYIASGFYVQDFFNFMISAPVIRYSYYAVDSGPSGNELILAPGCIIQQWTYTAGGESDLPVGITAGEAVRIQSGDAKIMGAVIAYYKTRGVRVIGRSCFITAGTHIYSAGKQAVYQEATGGNLNIDGAWLDSSRVRVTTEATIQNCRINTTTGTDSDIGIEIIGGVDVVVKNNAFLGSGASPIYKDASAQAEKTCVTYDNTYLGTASYSDVRDLTVTVQGGTVAGTGTYTKQIGKWSCDGVWAYFELEVSWSAHTGTGALLIYNLPFTGNADMRHPVTVWVGTSSLTGVTSAIIDGASGGIKLYSGFNQTTITSNGTVALSGRYRI